MRDLPMSGGIRIVHPTAPNAVVLVPDPTRPIAHSARCPSCQLPHPVKTYHIVTNDAGTAVVSPGVFAGLRRGGMGGFTVDAQVVNPPNQVLGPGGEVRPRESIVLYHQ